MTDHTKMANEALRQAANRTYDTAKLLAGVEMPERYDCVRDTERNVTEDVFTVEQLQQYAAAAAAKARREALEEAITAIEIANGCTLEPAGDRYTAAPAPQQVEQPDVLAEYTGTDGRRQWTSTGAWLYPGDKLAVISAAPAPQARQGEQSGAVVHQHGFAKENQRLRTINESLDKQLDDVMRECDRRDEIINDLCDAVLGTDRHEWSSMYFFEDAVREVEERMEALAQQGEPAAYVLSPTDIYDFAGWLTTRAGVMEIGASKEASPMAEAVGEYLRLYPERFKAAPAPQAQQPIIQTQIVKDISPMIPEEIRIARNNKYDPEDEPDAWSFEEGVRAAERFHGIGVKK